MNTLQETILSIGKIDGRQAGTLARERLDQLTMPYWALGRIMDLAVDLAQMTGRCPPPVARKNIVVMAADHGVTEENTSKYPREVTAQMVHNFVAGGAGINALAGQVGAGVVVVDMGVDAPLDGIVGKQKILSHKIGPGTGNMARGPAMPRGDAIKSIEVGIEIARQLDGSTDIFGTGDMGIGNTTPSSAIVSVLCDVSVDRVTGRGTGLDNDQLAHKKAVVKQALQTNHPDATDPIDVLAKVGGFEIGGIAGVILGAASLGKPVVVDGFISTAGALIAKHLAKDSVKFMIAAHKSVEPGHKIALDHLGLRPLLDLELRLGEGTGAALAMNLIDASYAVLTEIATFEEAEVSQAG